jgi:hypothetical protein
MCPSFEALETNLMSSAGVSCGLHLAAISNCRDALAASLEDSHLPHLALVLRTSAGSGIFRSMHDSDAFFDRRLEDSFNAGFTMSSSAPLNVRSCCHSAPSSGFGKSVFLGLPSQTLFTSWGACLRTRALVSR